MATVAEERNYKVISGAVSFTVHIMIFLLFFFTKMISDTPIPPVENGGVLVALGQPDQGMNDEPTPGPPSAESGEGGQAEEVEEVEPQPRDDKPEPVREEPSVSKPVKEREPEKVTTEDPNAIAIKQQQAKEKRDREEADRVRRAEDERKKAQADAAAKEEARRKSEADKLKGEIGGLFGNGKGKGSGGKTGNQGQPDGDPNGKALEGVSTGTGTIGGGLGSRGVARAPKIEDNTQQEGTVVLQVCVDQDGSVVSAEFTQKGSTISDGSLKNKAISNAKQWKFNKGEVEKQCGTITYRFRVQ